MYFAVLPIETRSSGVFVFSKAKLCFTGTLGLNSNFLEFFEPFNIFRTIFGELNLNFLDFPRFFGNFRNFIKELNNSLIYQTLCEPNMSPGRALQRLGDVFITTPRRHVSWAWLQEAIKGWRVRCFLGVPRRGDTSPGRG